MFVAEFDRRGKHEDVHEKVKLNDHGIEDPVGAADGGHNEEDEGKYRDDDRLCNEESNRHSMFVQFAEIGGEVATLRSAQQAFARTCDPSAQSSEGSEDEENGHERSEPVESIGIDEEGKGLDRTRNEADVLLRDDNRNG